ncbi:MAG: hypothetical protein ACTSR8_15690 [Promethearchaeota archaeon]
MNFQYYDTLKNKEKKNMIFYISEIRPEFNEKEISLILEDLKNSSFLDEDIILRLENFEDIDIENEKSPDFSKLKEQDLELLYKLFISHETADNKATKWRFYQDLIYMKNFYYDSIKINKSNTDPKLLDFIIKDNEKYIFVSCVYFLDLEMYLKIIKSIKEFSESENIIPERIIIAATKTFRNIPIEKGYNFNKKEIIPELWIEYVDLDKQFTGEDLLIIVNSENDEEVEVAGFNFINLDALLDYIFEETNGGQIIIYKQPGFFSELYKIEKPLELIWKGIMLKND